MSNIDKIRAEIDRLKGDIGLGLNEYDTGFENGKCEICNHILSFLDTLEEPVSEGLEEAAEGEWIWATTPPEKPGKYKVQLRYDTYSAIWNGVRWIDDASRFPIMGVFKWKPIKEDGQ